jgi:hypothetical protein
MKIDILCEIEKGIPPNFCNGAKPDGQSGEQQTAEKHGAYQT